MTIKEVEEQTGLTRSNIRFYEKENLSLKETEEIISIAQKAIKEHKQ